MAQSKLARTASWYLKCCRGQLSSRLLPGVSRQAQRAVHQLRLNRLSSTASYQALIGQIETPTCPHHGSGDKMAEHLLLLCPKWAAERQHYFGDSIDITDVYQDYESLVEFLICSGHLSPHIGSAWRARHDNNNNNNNVCEWQFHSISLRYTMLRYYRNICSIKNRKMKKNDTH